ncbi:hypothetical protein [Lysinibacillus sp. fls2-241-R2A-57]|uniref:hypothetical protein n=1 Tax=Lysinibacillus sp. fls2-241-R2A-57 TaxID=3040292 RepID=UPI002555B7C6|nr:hypothetical protein [Lysinibacillus sp. fls2-241-R2A-57]
MLKVTWESFKYSYFEYNIGIHVILTILVLGIAAATTFYALKAIIGVFFVAIITFCLLFLNDKKK